MQHLTSHDLGVAHAHLPLVIPWAFTWSKESAKPTAAWSFLRKECIGFILDKTCLDIYIYMYLCQCKYIYTYSCTHANIACHVHMPGLLVCISTASSGFIGLLLLLRKPIPRVIANSLSNEWQPEGRYDAQGCEVYIYVCMFILKYTCIHTCFGFGSICVSNGAWLGSWVHKDLPASTAGSVARCSGDAPLSSAWCRLCPCLSMPKK